MTLSEKVKATSELLKTLRMTAASKDCNEGNFKEYSFWVLRESIHKSLTASIKQGGPVFINYKGLALSVKLLALMISQGMLEDKNCLHKEIARSLKYFKNRGNVVTTEMYFWEKETVKYM